MRQPLTHLPLTHLSILTNLPAYLQKLQIAGLVAVRLDYERISPKFQFLLKRNIGPVGRDKHIDAQTERPRGIDNRRVQAEEFDGVIVCHFTATGRQFAVAAESKRLRGRSRVALRDVEHRIPNKCNRVNLN